MTTRNMTKNGFEIIKTEKMCVAESDLTAHSQACEPRERCLVTSWMSDQCPKVDCSAYSSCQQCATQKGCGWCASSQKCIEGGRLDSDPLTQHLDNSGSCEECEEAGSCFKSNMRNVTAENCPAERCSSMTRCQDCTQENGCGWDAADLNYVELKKEGVGEKTNKTENSRTCEKGPPEPSCLFEKPSQCPQPTNGLCSSHPSCSECTQDPACAWSSPDNKCVEASSVSGCRGTPPFSVFDCEPHCNSLQDCNSCHLDAAGLCTWCAGEFVNSFTKGRIERCVLSKGAHKGEGDRTAPEYAGHKGEGDRTAPEYAGHNCTFMVESFPKCSECSQYSGVFTKSGKGSEFKVGDCPSCVQNPHCVAAETLVEADEGYAKTLAKTLAVSAAGKGEREEKNGKKLIRVTNCVRGDINTPYSDGRVPPSPLPTFWSHRDDSPESLKCQNEDFCRTALSCDECQLPEREAKGCVWYAPPESLEAVKGAEGTDVVMGPKDAFSCRQRSRDMVDQYIHRKGECPTEPSCAETGKANNCIECVSGHDCAFAPEAGGCIESSTAFSNSYLPYVWGDPTKCPEYCGKHQSCETCAKDLACGWCGECLPVGQKKPENPETDRPGPDYVATGRVCEEFVKTYSAIGCRRYEKSQGDGKEEGGGGSWGFWPVFGWSILVLVILAFVAAGLWWWCDGGRQPQRTVPLMGGGWRRE
uniref:PSI domain-containing protein n=1 Tax=Chromera velia CCMP2878 TaxID=1169474 RepID=A0A0G4HH75_9ALVE|eukprot:Cvel_27536.t1-p1 / transcript=Cvel_27536.t1 / gene=Cvel_27536 / organism=Chromera_velia_CCMP2878 / gene_product=Multiple epidermal growth factor-like domains, putative / transcript_product=Multiple epidermal growth factor-like domains, putative / location=Cvel_scaffold3454:5968-8061(+) / protein_length=698 / sequence_SO=supercontig / SO=protein_coding / is_pseudo=false